PRAVFAFAEYWRSHGSGNASASSVVADSSVARSVTNAGVPKRWAASRRRGAISRMGHGGGGGGGGGGAYVRMRRRRSTKPSTVDTTEITIEPRTAPTMASESSLG